MTLPNIVFVFLIAIATGYLTFLTTKGGLTNNKFNNLNKRITKRGKTVICVLIIILSLLITQECNTQKVSKKNEGSLKIEMLKRDSIITSKVSIGVESNRKKLFEDLSKAFANEALYFDTLKNKIEIIRDSAITTINNFHGDNPILLLENNGISSKDTTKKKGTYQITFKSVDAGTSGFNIKSYILTETEDGYEDLSMLNLFPKGLKIPKNSNWSAGFGSVNNPFAKKIYIHIKGEYFNTDRTKKFEIDNLYGYDAIENKTSVLLNSQRENILNIIKKIPKEKLILRE